MHRSPGTTQQMSSRAAQRAVEPPSARSRKALQASVKLLMFKVRFCLNLLCRTNTHTHTHKDNKRRFAKCDNNMPTMDIEIDRGDQK